MGMTSFYNPPYYNRGKIQVWDFIRDQGLNYHLGNVVKYVCRAGHKKTVGNPTGDPLEDLDKAIHYLINERDYLRNGLDNHTGPTRNLPEQSGEGVSEDLSSWELNKQGTAD
jgi:hypothetical protein|tara:strand:+ start:266 stop:601 length:336 start_codon:yes stop_codon:yes gene_type:complete